MPLEYKPSHFHSFVDIAHQKKMSVIDLTSPEVAEEVSSVIRKIRVDNERIKPPIIQKRKSTLNNRNTDSRFDLTKKRKTPTAKIPAAHQAKRDKPKKGGKKECDLGTSCPYVNEYQHQLEFAHNNDKPESTNAIFSGGGNRLGDSLSSSSSSSSSFIGTKGQKLGGNSSGTDIGSGSYTRASCSNRTGHASRPEGRDSRYMSTAFWQEHQTASTHKAHHHPVESDRDHTTEYVECAMCSSLVELFNYDKHLQAHEDKERQATFSVPSSHGNTYTDHHYQSYALGSGHNAHHRPKSHASSDLMKKQDEEYEKAELEDIMRLHHQGKAPAVSSSATSLSPSPPRSKNVVETGTSIVIPPASEVIDIHDDDDDDDANDADDAESSSKNQDTSGRAITKRIASGPKISLAFRFKFSSAPAAGDTLPPAKVVESFHVDSLLQVGTTIFTTTRLLL